MRETGRRRPSRKGPQRGSRGEAARDFVFVAVAFSPAPAGRILPVRGTGAATAPEFNPARSDMEIRPGIQYTERVQRRKNSRGRATRTWPTAASGPKTLTEQARRIYCREIVTIPADDDPMGGNEEQKGVFP